MLPSPLNTKDRNEEGSSAVKGHRNVLCLIDSTYNRGTVRKWQNNAVPPPHNHHWSAENGAQSGWCMAINQWSSHTYHRPRVCAGCVWISTWKHFSTRWQQTLHHLWLPHLPKLHTYLLPSTARSGKTGLWGQHSVQQTSTWHNLTLIVPADSQNKC